MNKSLTISLASLKLRVRVATVAIATPHEKSWYGHTERGYRIICHYHRAAEKSLDEAEMGIWNSRKSRQCLWHGKNAHIVLGWHWPFPLMHFACRVVNVDLAAGTGPAVGTRLAIRMKAHHMAPALKGANSLNAASFPDEAHNLGLAFVQDRATAHRVASAAANPVPADQSPHRHAARVMNASRSRLLFF